MSKSSVMALVAAMIAVGSFAVVKSPRAAAAADEQQKKERFFELRRYTAAEGKLDALHARFRDHTNKLFVKHGIELVGFWTPADEAKGAKDTLIYILAYPSREAREKSWKAFSADPEWIAARTESEKNGRLVTKVDSTFMNPTDYSPMK
ncbi:MAG TPA: NIPSNAP family protein [Tepidisphaeraceae bacterium]|jgi:hypothetical protein